MQRLVEYVSQNGGMTYNPMTGEMPTTGYMCAVASNEFILDGALTENALISYMHCYARDLQQDNAHVGVWYNSENGKTYLDTSYRFDDVDSALQFARDNNQLAIFDLSTYEEIRL
jgi:hypothetical protein